MPDYEISKFVFIAIGYATSSGQRKASKIMSMTELPKRLQAFQYECFKQLYSKGA